LYGLWLILTLIVTGGLVAWLGDTVGRKVGRKRLTVFGLRPRHSSIIITMITGVLIVASTLFILSIVSEDVRTALFSMKQLQATLQENQVQMRLKDAEIQDKQSRARALEMQIAKKSDQFDALNGQMQTVLTQRNAVDTALRTVKNELQQIQGQYKQVISDYQNAQTNLSSTSQQLSFEKSRVDRLKELAQPLADAVENLTKEVEGLTTEKKKLEKEVNSLQTDLFFGSVAYKADEIVSSTVIKGGRPIEAVKKDLLSFLNGPANDAAKKRGAKIEGKDTALQVVPEHFEQAAQLVSKTDDLVVVRAVSYANTLVGNPVPVYFQLYRNQKIFDSGELIAEKRIDSTLPPDQILMEILALLSDVNEHAIQQGMVTTAEGTVGQTTNWTEIPAAISQVKSLAGTVVVQAVAVSDTWSATGPLQVRFDIRAAKAPASEAPKVN
jgi:uncharacterized protein (DUF3084 family)